MADAYGIGIDGCFDTQSTATTMRSFCHIARSFFRYSEPTGVRLSELPLVSIVLLAPVSLAQLPKSLSGGLRGTSRRRRGGFAKEVARNVKNGEAPTLLRAGFRNPLR